MQHDARRSLLRIELAWAGCIVATMVEEVALAVYAFGDGGVSAVGVAALVRSLPAGLLGPLVAAHLSHHHPTRHMRITLVLRLTVLAAAALVIAAGWPSWGVYALAGVGATALTVYWPAQTAMLPTAATTTDELTRANLVLTATEHGAALVGPAVAAGAIALSGASAAFAVAAVVTAFGFAASLGVLGGTGAVEAVGERSPFRGYAAVAANRGARLLVGVFGTAFLCIGAVRVLVVPVAIELVGLGDGGVGLLTAAIGVGGLAGTALSLQFAARRRLARPLVRMLLVWGMSTAAVLLVSNGTVAASLLVVTGAAVALLDLTALTLLQRLVRDRDVDPVFAVAEGTSWVGIGIGGAIAAALADRLGVRPTLGIVGAVLAVLAVGSAGALRRIDVRARYPEPQIAALRAVHLFDRLPPLAFERLALDLVWLRFQPGDRIIGAGEPGDRFYMIHEGSALARTDEVEQSLGPGDWFGEIALLHDVPRTATVSATSDLVVLALDRHEFLAAITARGSP